MVRLSNNRFNNVGWNAYIVDQMLSLDPSRKRRARNSLDYASSVPRAAIATSPDGSAAATDNSSSAKNKAPPTSSSPYNQYNYRHLKTTTNGIPPRNLYQDASAEDTTRQQEPKSSLPPLKQKQPQAEIPYVQWAIILIALCFGLYQLYKTTLSPATQQQQTTSKKKTKTNHGKKAPSKEKVLEEVEKAVAKINLDTAPPKTSSKTSKNPPKKKKQPPQSKKASSPDGVSSSASTSTVPTAKVTPKAPAVHREMLYEGDIIYEAEEEWQTVGSSGKPKVPKSAVPVQVDKPYSSPQAVQEEEQMTEAALQQAEEATKENATPMTIVSKKKKKKPKTNGTNGGNKQPEYENSPSQQQNDTSEDEALALELQKLEEQQSTPVQPQQKQLQQQKHQSQQNEDWAPVVSSKKKRKS